MIRFAIAAAFVGLIGVVLASNAKADEWNKKTVFTVNEPIQVTDKVLPAGKYVMKLLDSPSDRHIVQIFNRNENHLIATVLAIPDYRVQPTGDTVLTFYEAPPGQPKALRDWFYPGDNFGQQFPRPQYQAQTITAASPTPAVAPTEPPRPAPAPEPQQEVAQNTPPPSPPAPVAPREEAAATPEPAPQPAPAPSELPKTASDLTWIGLAGIGSLGIFALVRVHRLA
jgi:hypothetical protein